MRKYLCVLVSCVVFVGFAAAKECSNKGRVELGLQGGGILFEGNALLDEDELLGGWIGYSFSHEWAVEATYLTGDTEIRHSEYESGVQIPFGELQHNFTGHALQPFVSFGAGGLIIDPETESGLLKRSDFVAGYGAGLKWFLAKHLAARLQVRHLINTELSGSKNYTVKNYGIMTAGMSLLFGGAKQVPRVVDTVITVITDTDYDGISDDKDQCPDTPVGVTVDASGCPIDTDKDGVPDYLDACADTPVGTKVDAKGCPVPEFLSNPEKAWVLSSIAFESGKDTVKRSSIPALDEAAAILTDNPSVTVEIQGHTDSVGSDVLNQKLSLLRATTVKNYLVAKGISNSRLTVKGYGETQPIRDNATKEGRAQNRRIQFKVLSK